jgi:hypothetical protein
VDSCPPLHFLNASSSVCASCSSLAINCTNCSSSTTCLSCDVGYLLFLGNSSCRK